MSVSVTDVDDFEAVNALQVFADGFSSDVWFDEADDDVSSRSTADSTCDVSRHEVLALVPVDFDLCELAVSGREASSYIHACP